MAKILTDKEMLDIVRRAIEDKNEIEDAGTYEQFLEELGNLIALYFGGERGVVGIPDHGGDLGWTCCFHINDSVPDDGGIFKDYDKDVTWQNGEENQS